MDKKSKYLALAVAVAGGSSIRSAAAAVGCSESRAYHISSSDEFRERVAAIRSEIAAATVGVLTDGATKAALTVVELLDEKHEPSVRLTAAKAIFAALGPMTDVGELRARLDALEAANRGARLGVA